MPHLYLCISVTGHLIPAEVFRFDTVWAELSDLSPKLKPGPAVFQNQRAFLQNGTQSFHQCVRITFSEDQRRLDLDHIVQRAVHAQQNAALFHALHGVYSVLGTGEFDTEKQAETAHIGNLTML